jgi:hypothetical protein
LAFDGRSASCPGWGKCPWNPFNRRLGVPQSWSGYWRREKLFALAGNQTLAIQPIACHYTELPQQNIISRSFKFKKFQEELKISTIH